MKISRPCILVLFMALIPGACSQESAEHAQTAQIIPDREVLDTDAQLSRKQGILYYAGNTFSGRLVERRDDRSIERRSSYYRGKAHGRSEAWYPDGRKKEERMYRNGKKVGLHKGWWPNGQVKFAFTFENGLHEGSAKEWYVDGKPFREAHYHKGIEQGSQKMWNRDGSLKANYVVKNGRRYGLVGSKPCVNPVARDT